MSLAVIQSQLEEKIGFPIDTVSACRKLERILKERACYVSYTTLSRIFGLAAISAVARESTLNELSRFLGFENYELFLFFHSEREEVSRKKIIAGVELQALLLTNNDRKAIDYLVALKDDYPAVFRYNSQFVCKHLFDKSKKDGKKGMDYFLTHEQIAYEVFQHFVYEDDPQGHYSSALERLIRNNRTSDDLYLFHKLFEARKFALSGIKNNLNIEVNSNAHYHLISRSCELELLLYRLSDKQIVSRTFIIIELLERELDRNKGFAFVGRWCRGLLMTDKYHLLVRNDEWKNLCLSLMSYNEYNIEFQVIIFSFLKLAYGVEVSLDFMFRGKWENSKLESGLLLSMAFSKENAFRLYKDLLGYR